MKKFICILLILISVPLFCACEVSNTELANSLEGNLTRLVYSIGYLDSISTEELSNVVNNSSYFTNSSLYNGTMNPIVTDTPVEENTTSTLDNSAGLNGSEVALSGGLVANVTPSTNTSYRYRTYTSGLNNNLTTNTSVDGETTSNVGVVDLSLIENNEEMLNSILIEISGKRGIIMLYCTDLRSGKATLSNEDKLAINEYNAIIKETTNYLNNNAGTLTNYFNGISSISTNENSAELINAKLIRANELLKTRYAKLDTCLDSLDAVINILVNSIGSNYAELYNNSLNNTINNSQVNTQMNNNLDTNINLDNSNMVDGQNGLNNDNNIVDNSLNPVLDNTTNNGMQNSCCPYCNNNNCNCGNTSNGFNPTLLPNAPAVPTNNFDNINNLNNNNCCTPNNNQTTTYPGNFLIPNNSINNLDGNNCCNNVNNTSSLNNNSNTTPNNNNLNNTNSLVNTNNNSTNTNGIASNNPGNLANGNANTINNNIADNANGLTETEIILNGGLVKNQNNENIPAKNINSLVANKTIKTPQTLEKINETPELVQELKVGRPVEIEKQETKTEKVKPNITVDEYTESEKELLPDTLPFTSTKDISQELKPLKHGELGIISKIKNLLPFTYEEDDVTKKIPRFNN